MAGFPNVPVMPAMDQKQAPLKGWLEGFRRVANNMMRGKTNNVGSVTLTANAASTTLNDPLIGGSSRVHLSASTANAAAEAGGTALYIDGYANGSCTIHHANNAQTDRTFLYTVVG